MDMISIYFPSIMTHNNISMSHLAIDIDIASIHPTSKRTLFNDVMPNIFVYSFI